MLTNEETLRILSESHAALLALSRYLQYGATTIPTEVGVRWLSVADQLKKLELKDHSEWKLLETVALELGEAGQELKVQSGRINKQLKQAAQLGRLAKQLQAYLNRLKESQAG